MAFASDFTSEEKEQLSHARRWFDEVDEIARGFILAADAGNRPQLGYTIGQELYDIKWCSTAVSSKQHWDKLFSILNRSVATVRMLQNTNAGAQELKDIEVKLTLAYRSIRLVEMGTFRPAS